MAKLRFPFSLVITQKTPELDIDKVFSFLDGKNVNYNKFEVTKNSVKQCVALPNLVMNLDVGSIDDAQRKLTYKLKTIREEIGKILNTKVLIRRRKILCFLWHGDYEFEGVRIQIPSSLLRKNVVAKSEFKGHINKNKIEAFTRGLLNNVGSILELLGQEAKKEKQNLIQTINEDDLDNFLFLRSLLDYGNVTPSGPFTLVLLEIYKKYSFLFRPHDKVWDELLKKPEEEREKIICIPLLSLAGLFRRSFSQFVKDWVNMIVFLRKTCGGNANNLFEKLIEKFCIDPSDPYALEKVQLLLEKEVVKDKLSMAFPYSKKIGRLLFTLMTKNKRGYGVLKGVKEKHVENLNLPVDTQIIRVSLNLGLVSIDDAESEAIEKIRENVVEGLKIMRSDFTEICQKAWKMVAKGVSEAPIDLDYYIWSVGALFCKRFGEVCYFCPLTDICDSWKQKKVMESRGAERYKGCYSYARPQTGVDCLIIRACPNCPHNVQGGCKQGYPIRIYDVEKEKMPKEIIEKISSPLTF